jgi:hypothetical protein
MCGVLAGVTAVMGKRYQGESLGWDTKEVC